MKRTITELDSLKGFYSSFEMAEERISDLEDRNYSEKRKDKQIRDL